MVNPPLPPVSARPMGRWRRGWTLAGLSWRVLNEDRKLLLLPILSFGALALTTATFLGIGVVAGAYGTAPRPVAYPLLFLFYVTASFVTFFFNAALIGAVVTRLQGGRASLGDALRMARAHAGKILLWALVSATVGTILRAIQERVPLAGQIVVSIIGFAWNVATAFVVPVLIFENLGTMDSIKRSGKIFTQRWGENFVGNGAIGLVLLLLAIPAIAVSALLIVVSPPLGILALILVVGAFAIIGTAISAVFRAALYQYAVTGESAGGFSADLLAGGYRARRSRLGF